MVTDVHCMEGDFSRLEVLAIELKVWSPNHQCFAFRLETRATEFVVMASLNLKRWRRRETEFSQHCEEKRVKVR